VQVIIILLYYLIYLVELKAKDKNNNVVSYQGYISVRNSINGQPVLQSQKWIDGSVGADLPVNKYSINK
jgi:hypothetical protein